MNESEIDTLVKNLDTDGNGQIDFKEFVGAVMLERRDSLKASLRKAFDAIDSDKSGFLSVQEVTSAILFS